MPITTMRLGQWRLERAQLVPRPRREVFAFFSDAFNLERITPSSLRFRILTPRPIVLAAGTLIDYELRLHGVPLRWRSLIEAFEPESGFTDVQVKGPYRSWRHRHAFAEVAGGTEMRDEVDYALPFGPLGTLAHGLFVRPQLERIFDHRRAAVAAIFPP